MRVIEVIVQLEAHSQHRICSFVVAHPNFEQGLTEVSAKVQGWPDMTCCGVFSAVVQILAKLPTGFPGLLLHVPFASKVEYPLAMYVAEISQRVAQRPAFCQSRSQRGNFLFCVPELAHSAIDGFFVIARLGHCWLSILCLRNVFVERFLA